MEIRCINNSGGSNHGFTLIEIIAVLIVVDNTDLPDLPDLTEIRSQNDDLLSYE